MASQDDPPKFDHVVTVMFENRSFDNLLGHLARFMGSLSEGRPP